MAYQDFVKLLAADTKTTPDKLLEEKAQSFPLTSNERGKALLESLAQVVDYDFRGKRVLDIGCAYGGYSIALAKAGASVSGIDVSPKFIEYATANAASTVDVDFDTVDASSVGVRRKFKKGSFDFVVLNDVLEHIYDTASLVGNLDWLLNDKGIVFFKVPNGFSPRFVLSEGHRKIFGLTVLDPDCWFYLHPKRASIFYRPLSHFQGIFSHFGLPQQLLVDDERVFTRMTTLKLKNQIKEIFGKARDLEHPSSQFKAHLRQGILRFRDEFMYDVEVNSQDFVKYKYGSYFFNGFFARRNAKLQALTKVRQLPGYGAIAEKSADAESKAA